MVIQISINSRDFYESELRSVSDVLFNECARIERDFNNDTNRQRVSVGFNLAAKLKKIGKGIFLSFDEDSSFKLMLLRLGS